MTDLYLLATVRMRELQREADAARRARPPEDVGQTVHRSRIVLAQWLMGAAERLWPEACREATGGAL